MEFPIVSRELPLFPWCPVPTSTPAVPEINPCGRTPKSHIPWGHGNLGGGMSGSRECVGLKRDTQSRDERLKSQSAPEMEENRHSTLYT